MTKNAPFKAFAFTFCLVAVALCIYECSAMSTLPGTRERYGFYCLFLILASLSGGLIGSGIAWAMGQRAMKELRSNRMKIADLERSAETLQHTAARREEFIASFAHELKTPLTAIIGYADMLRSKEMTPTTRFKAAGYIFSEGKRLEALSLKLMDIIVAGKQDFETRRFEVGYFIRSVSAVVIPSLSNEGMTLDMRWEPGEIEIEPDLCKTLIINLVDNARKASKRGDTIELFGKNEQGGYALYVRDHGRGMKKEDLERITEPFYMIDKSRSRAQNGAGLGLALCQRIAELHGTELEFDSEPGRGTAVRLLLKGGAPRERAEQTS
ncbi:MAG: HAMP domain-containing histidine kinase [Oscillospiraceae bacterium]|nr:HAMP domain-containing histidine kinase [Oscillospiraceae bacterium]